MRSDVGDYLVDADADVDFIPTGYTNRLQPLDIGINKPFKDAYRQQFLAWLVNNPKTSPTRYEVASWVIAAFESISEEVIHASFASPGFVDRWATNNVVLRAKNSSEIELE